MRSNKTGIVIPAEESKRSEDTCSDALSSLKIVRNGVLCHNNHSLFCPEVDSGFAIMLTPQDSPSTTNSIRFPLERLAEVSGYISYPNNNGTTHSDGCLKDLHFERDFRDKRYFNGRANSLIYLASTDLEGIGSSSQLQTGGSTNDLCETQTRIGSETQLVSHHSNSQDRADDPEYSSTLDHAHHRHSRTRRRSHSGASAVSEAASSAVVKIGHRVSTAARYIGHSLLAGVQGSDHHGSSHDSHNSHHSHDVGRIRSGSEEDLTGDINQSHESSDDHGQSEAAGVRAGAEFFNTVDMTISSDAGKTSSPIQVEPGGNKDDAVGRSSGVSELNKAYPAVTIFTSLSSAFLTPSQNSAVLAPSSGMLGASKQAGLQSNATVGGRCDTSYYTSAAAVDYKEGINLGAAEHSTSNSVSTTRQRQRRYTAGSFADIVPESAVQRQHEHRPRPRAYSASNSDPESVRRKEGSKGKNNTEEEPQRNRVEVIIKIIPKHHMGNSVAEAEYASERAILAAVRHPNIISLLGFGHDTSDTRYPPRPFLVLEYLSGGTLTKLLSSSGKVFGSHQHLSLATAVGFGRDIASALKYLHHDFHPEAVLIHRDLKPDNIW